ncbi:hypothetical protein Tco_0005625 [Tanacetum coccineum]
MIGVWRIGGGKNEVLIGVSEEVIGVSEEVDWLSRAPRNQGNGNRDAGYRSRDNTRRTVPVDTSDALVFSGTKALLSKIDWDSDWRYIAQDEPTEFALMAYTSTPQGPDTREPQGRRKSASGLVPQETLTFYSYFCGMANLTPSFEEKGIFDSEEDARGVKITGKGKDKNKKLTL